MKIKWKGATLDPSGYGSANRDYITALHSVGVDITIEPWNFEANSASFYGEAGKLVEHLKNRDITYTHVIHHYVPNIISKRYEEGKINIGISTWEADQIPEHWISEINTYLDAQIVPSAYNAKAYANSGITIPIYVVPHCIDITPFTNADVLSYITSAFKHKFKILSVFQFIERKNPKGLLKAYFSAFYDHKDVVLILKTYGLDHSDTERNRIKQTIQQVKKATQLDPNKLPQVFLISEVITREQMLSLYKTTDCFALPTRSEGFGLPFAEACAGQNVIVASNYSGQIDFLAETAFSYLVSTQETPIAYMNFPHYNSLMTWGEPSLIEFKRGLQYFYDMWKNDRFKLKDLQYAAAEHIHKKLNHQTIGKHFKYVLENIC